MNAFNISQTFDLWWAKPLKHHVFRPQSQGGGQRPRCLQCFTSISLPNNRVQSNNRTAIIVKIQKPCFWRKQNSLEQCSQTCGASKDMGAILPRRTTKQRKHRETPRACQSDVRGFQKFHVPFFSFGGDHSRVPAGPRGQLLAWGWVVG